MPPRRDSSPCLGYNLSAAGKGRKARSMAGDAMTRAGGAGVPARPRGRADAGLSIVVPLFNEGDGQHPPALVEKLVGYWLDDGYDVVYTAKAHRASEPWLRRLGVKTFYALINWGARQKIPEDAGDFRLLSPRAAAALKQLPERNRFFKGLASWIGFRQIRVDYEPAERI